MNERECNGLAYTIAASCLTGMLETDIIDEVCKREQYSERDSAAIKKAVKEKVIAHLMTIAQQHKRQNTRMHD